MRWGDRHPGVPGRPECRDGDLSMATFESVAGCARHLPNSSPKGAPCCRRSWARHVGAVRSPDCTFSIAFVVAVLQTAILFPPTESDCLLGGRVDAGVPALRILLVGQVIAASAGSQMRVMAMTGHERTAAAQLVVGRLPIPSRASIDVFGVVGAALVRSQNSRWRSATGFDPRSTPVSRNGGACNKPACERFPSVSAGLGPSRV
jgi:hypothetical protein